MSKNVEKAERKKRIVLVGTCKGDQLARWRGWYNCPISGEDKITETDAAKSYRASHPDTLPRRGKTFSRSGYVQTK